MPKSLISLLKCRVSFSGVVILTCALFPLRVFSQTELPWATSGMPYAVQLGVSVSGVYPFRLSVEGTLPPGLVVSDSALLQGVPVGTNDTDYVFALVVTDGRGSQTRTEFRVHLSPRPQVIMGKPVISTDPPMSPAPKPATQMRREPDVQVDPPQQTILRAARVQTQGGAATRTAAASVTPAAAPVVLTGQDANQPKNAEKKDAENKETQPTKDKQTGADAQSQVKCPTPQKPAVVGELTAGGTVVRGSSTPPGSNCPTRVVLWTFPTAYDPVKKPVDQPGARLLGLVQTVQPNATDGNFTALLAEPLEEGNKVVVEESFNNGEPIQSPASVVLGAPWGRVKAYFTSGILLSNDQQQFSNTQGSLFLSFDLDKSWSLPYKFLDRASGNDEPGHLKRQWGRGISTFFNARLTSIPTAVQQCPSGTTGSGATPGAGSGSTGGGAGGTNTGCTTPSGGTTQPLETFLTSRKTARFQLGAYFPQTLTRWKYRSQQNVLVLAPLAKAGFDTPTESFNQLGIQTQSQAATGSTGPVVPVNNGHFFTNYGFGTRIGHYSIVPNADEGAELISYLDVVMGRFSNLEDVRTDGNRSRPYRASLEGILKVPNTPLIIGFSANIRLGSIGSGNTKTTAPDDLRFLFGTRFDIGKLLQNIASKTP